MGQLYREIYCLPIWVTLLGLVLLFLLWRQLRAWRSAASPGQKRAAAAFLAAGFLLWLLVILHMTVFSRSSGTREAHLLPFYRLYEYANGGPRELLRTLWMNVLLFVPGGLLLQALWPQKWRRSICMVLTVLLLTCASIAIEAIQYRYALGCAETDDVLCNLFGALLGAAIRDLTGYQKTARF